MTKWKPIETAPKYEVLDIATENGEVTVGELVRGISRDYYWRDLLSPTALGREDEIEYEEIFGPTHWRPRPHPPKEP